jgi:putative YphP/YqiW family bacilliredoxin
MYPEHLVAPMRADIVEGGFKELKSAGEVDSVMTEKGTTLVFINSVCGCSARTARPGVKEAVWNAAKNQIICTQFSLVLTKMLQLKYVSTHCLTLHHLHQLRFSKMVI